MFCQPWNCFWFFVFDRNHSQQRENLFDWENSNKNRAMEFRMATTCGYEQFFCSQFRFSVEQSNGYIIGFVFGGAHHHHHRRRPIGIDLSAVLSLTKKKKWKQKIVEKAWCDGKTKKNENIPPCDGSMRLVRCEGRFMLQISCERSVSCNSIKTNLQKGLDKSMYWFFGSKLYGAMVPSHVWRIRVLSRITYENREFILWTHNSNGNKSLIDRIICLRLDFFSCAIASKVIYIEREPLSASIQTKKIVWFPSANVR